jgi:hypothetical protein
MVLAIHMLGAPGMRQLQKALLRTKVPGAQISCPPQNAASLWLAHDPAEACTARNLKPYGDPHLRHQWVKLLRKPSCQHHRIKVHWAMPSPPGEACHAWHWAAQQRDNPDCPAA